MLLSLKTTAWSGKSQCSTFIHGLVRLDPSWKKHALLQNSSPLNLRKGVLSLLLDQSVCLIFFLKSNYAGPKFINSLHAAV